MSRFVFDLFIGNNFATGTLSCNPCLSHVCVSCTHGLSVDRVDSKEECRDEGQARVFECTAFTCVHEQARYSTVQTHVDHVEIERRHAVQQDVQPDIQRERERDIQLSVSFTFP